MQRLFASLLALSNSVASLWVMALMLLITADVVGRGFFNMPIPGVPEIVKFSVVAMFWLQIAYTLRTGKHLRTTLLLGVMPRWMQTSVLVVNCLLGIAIFGFIVWLGWGEMMVSYENDIFEGEHPVRILVWPIWATLVFGAVLMALQYLLDVVRLIVRGPYPHETQELVE